MTTEARRTVTEIETFTGQYVDLLNPDPATICIEDIAVQLANTCRYAGAVTQYYSVAEHAVRVSQMVPKALALKALHHDSHEAYVGDVTAPLKAVIKRKAPLLLETITVELDTAIFTALGIEPISLDDHRRIKEADDHALFREAAALKYSHGRGPHWGNTHYYKPWADIGWSPKKAAREFLNRHQELMK